VGNDTTMMTWKQLRQQRMNCKVELQEDAYKQLREHELYMKNKGFERTIHEVFSPTGELLWKRQSAVQ